MKQTIRHTILLLACSLLLSGTVMAQRISFGLYATDGIVLTDLTELNFNTKQQIIIGGETVPVSLTDDGVAVMSITGRTDLDITVTIDAQMTLDLDATNTIPLVIRFAYSNTGASNDTDAKMTAIEVPIGFTSVTFPVKRRTSGLPAPPPTPNYAGYVAPTATAYLFVYGTLGPVPANAAAGMYTGNINIHAEYAKY